MGAYNPDYTVLEIGSFAGPRSLMEQCTSAIMCALLQQCGSLKPEQLHVRLPDYVPTTVKHTLTHTFKAHTLQLQVPTPRLTNIEHRV